MQPGAQAVRGKVVKFDKNYLVLPKLRYRTAVVEDEVLQLSSSGTELVALGYRGSIGCTGTLLTP
jgi:RNase P/RNase MRP subunit p29